MSEPTILTPLTEIEKAELLDAIPGNLVQRQWLRRLLSEVDQLRQRAAEDAATILRLERFVRALNLNP